MRDFNAKFRIPCERSACFVNNPLELAHFWRLIISDRVLITGANGFVGRHLCEALSSKGHNVGAAVRTLAGNDIAGVRVVQGCDVTKGEGWSSALDGVDCVVHCAARVHVMKESADNPLAAFRQVNVEGTLRVAQTVVDAGVRRFVFLSSVKVLGESTTGRRPFTELDELAPEDAYGRSKWEAEQALRALAAETGLEVVIVRCPLVYGPGVGGNFRSLMRLADSPWPLPFGGIDNARSLVFVGNLVDFLVHVIHAREAGGETFLVSDGADLSTTKLVELLRNAFGRPSRLFRFPWRSVMPFIRLAGREAAVERLLGSLQVDIAKASDILDWQPPFSVEQGIADTVNFRR